MNSYYQDVWLWLWPFIVTEWISDIFSIYALFRPFSGAFKVFLRYNFLKFLFGLGFASFIKMQGGFAPLDIFLIGSAPLTFLTTFLFLM